MTSLSFVRGNICVDFLVVLFDRTKDVQLFGAIRASQYAYMTLKLESWLCLYHISKTKQESKNLCQRRCTSVSNDFSNRNKKLVSDTVNFRGTLSTNALFE